MYLNTSNYQYWYISRRTNPRCDKLFSASWLKVIHPQVRVLNTCILKTSTFILRLSKVLFKTKNLILNNHFFIFVCAVQNFRQSYNVFNCTLFSTCTWEWCNDFESCSVNNLLHFWTVWRNVYHFWFINSSVAYVKNIYSIYINYKTIDGVNISASRRLV